MSMLQIRINKQFKYIHGKSVHTFQKIYNYLFNYYYYY